MNFKESRIKARLTLRQVEAKTGLSNSYLSQLENGKIKNPSFQTVTKLMSLYNVATPINLSEMYKFIEWTGENFMWVHGGWIARYMNQIKARVRTTEELHELYASKIKKHFKPKHKIK